MSHNDDGCDDEETQCELCNQMFKKANKMHLFSVISVVNLFVSRLGCVRLDEFPSKLFVYQIGKKQMYY